MTKANSKWLKLGVVGKAHGLRGFFFVSARDEPVPPTVKTIRIGADPEAAADIKIELKQWQAGRPVLKCEGIADRTAAELLTGKVVWCTDDQVILNDESEFLISDLSGRQVFDVNGLAMGVVEEAFEALTKIVTLVVFDKEKNADLEIPMIDAYVDMSFKRGDGKLLLKVPLDTFEDIWNDRKPKK